MKKKIVIVLLIVLNVLSTSISKAQTIDSIPIEVEGRSQVIGWVDNNAYWIRMAEKGLAVLNPYVKVPEAVYIGSRIKSVRVTTDDSPDVPVIDVGSSTQSENSVFVDPGNAETMLNSNNSTAVTGLPPLYGADYLYTFDFGETFNGSKNGAGGDNGGDPAACIGTDGRWYIGYIANGGQAVAYSDNQGESWTRKQAGPNPGGQGADKNHLWIDSKEGSPYENRLYDAWTDFGGAYNNHIVVTYSSDNGEIWSTRQRISLGVNAGHHNQGVNLSTGPNGEVYAAWGIYDGWPQDEKSIGFAKSLDGGQTWETAFRAINNIRGIRKSGVPQQMRVNSYPSMAVDVSDCSNKGTIYVVWTNVGVPGQNSDSDRDVYLIKSVDKGDTWSDPIRVNQDPINQGKAHYLPWITCDPSNGTISVIWYDNRNTSSNQAEAWVATSSDAGETWDDFKVSDVAFTPTPIPGTAPGYFGDYLGISSYNGHVYPTWTDNRSGHAMTYVSPFVISDIFLVLQDITVSIGQIENYQASNTITAAGNSTFFIVEGNGSSGGNATFLAGDEIVMKPGFHVYEGADFYANIEPCGQGNKSTSTPTNPSLANNTGEMVDLLFKGGSTDASLENTISIHPNPNAGIFDITFSKPVKEPITVEVRNMIGVIVFNEDVNGKNSCQVDISSHPSGLYFVHVNLGNKRLLFKKIIKR